MEKTPHPGLLPESYMAQEKESPNLISLLSNDHSLICESSIVHKAKIEK